MEKEKEYTIRGDDRSRRRRQERDNAYNVEKSLLARKVEAMVLYRQRSAELSNALT